MAVLRQLASRLRRGIERNRVPGASIAVLRGRRVIASAAAGVTNVDTGVEVTTDAVFQIGSISKIFTTTLVMQLVDEGLLDLDVPIVEYLPEFRCADADTRKRVTARHFLCHSSGIDGDYFVDSGRGDDSIARFVAMASMLPSVYPIGTKMSYCNVGFAVLGRVIEVLRRDTFDAVLKGRIFDPLGMKHAMTLPEDALRFRCAVGHVPSAKDPRIQQVAPAMYLSQGQKAAGSMPAMSAPDLLQFAAMHLNHGRSRDGARILSAGSVAAMQRRQIRLQRNNGRAATGWGLGWILCDWGKHRVVGHDGGTMGQYSFLRVAPGKNIAVALLTNGGDAGGLYQDVLLWTFAELANMHEPPIPPPDSRLRVDAARYLGSYENISTRYSIAAHRGGLRLAAHPKGDIGVPIERAPLAFIDRETATLRTGHKMLDRTTLLFSELVDGRYRYVQVGSRQFRRV